MNFKPLHEKAKLLDELIDKQIKIKRNSFAPTSILQEIVFNIYPDSYMINFGLHKLVFYLRHNRHELVLKIGKTQAIERDHKASIKYQEI